MVATLSLLSTSRYAALARLAHRAGLVADLNSIISKVNETINSLGIVATLTVGTIAGYYLSGDSWLYVDGVHPPTVSALRIQSQDTGSFYDITLTGDPGLPVLTLTPA